MMANLKLSCKSVLLYVRLAVFLGLHTLFVSLALAQGLSSDGAVSWYVVFSPLFVFDLLSVVYMVFYLASYVTLRRDGDSVWSRRYSTLFPGQKFSLVLLLAYAVGILLKVTAEILVLLRLEDVSSVGVIVPAILLMVLFAGVGLLALGQALVPMLNMWTHSTHFRRINHCMGYLDRCFFRRCVYLVCTACMN